MTKRIALTTLASLLSLGLLGSGCDTEDSSTTEREALLFVDGEPITNLEDASDTAVSLLVGVLQERLEAPPTAEEDLAFRAQCVADCGDHMMSISGDVCRCTDGEGCGAVDEGMLYEVTCDGESFSEEW